MSGRVRGALGVGVAVVAVFVVAVVLSGCAAVEPAPVPAGTTAEPASLGPAADVHDLAVTGFIQAGGDGDRISQQIADDAPALAMVGVDGVVLTDGGRAVASPSQTALDALAAAHEAGVDAELLVSNFDEQLGDFSPAIAATLLGDPATSDAVAASLGTVVAEQGWDGVMIDLESMDAAQAPGLAEFATQLRAHVAPGIRVDIAVQAAPSADEYMALGFDLTALASAVDHMTLMAYDQHGPWAPDDPGPVGALDWQREVLAAMLDQVPAAQVDLGVAAYGYVFDGDDSRSVSPAEARALAAAAGAEAAYDDVAGEWTAQLPGGAVVWWSDLTSLAARLDLARESGIAGASIWSLDLTDRLVA